MSKKNPKNPMDHSWTTHMETLTKRKKQIEISEKLSEAISEWYTENGLPEPDWRPQSDPQWWTDYLKSLDNRQ
jgi:hypothetical protein